MPEGDFKPSRLEIEKWVGLRIEQWSVLICLWSPQETVNNTWSKAEHTHSHIYAAKQSSSSVSVSIISMLPDSFVLG